MMSGRRVATCGLLTMALGAVLVAYPRADIVRGVLLIATCFSALFTIAEGATLQLNLSARNGMGFRMLIITTAIMALFVEISLRTIGTHVTYLERSGRFRFLAAYHSQYEATQPTWFKLYKPNSPFTRVKAEFAFPRTTNSIGLCEEEIPRDKPRGEYRALALGDSYTEGIGAPYEATWAQALQQQYARDGLPVRVLNAGISGSDPWFEFVLLRDKLLDAQPDLVLVAVNASDVTDVMMRGDDQRFLPDGSTRFTRRPRAWEGLYGISFLTRHLVHDVLGYDYLLMSGQELEAERTKAVNGLIAALQAFARLSGERGFRLLVVVHPDSWEALHGYTPEIMTVLTELQRMKLPVADVLGYWRNTGVLQRRQTAALYWPLDGHHNAEGYALLATAVRHRLDELAWPRALARLE